MNVLTEVLVSFVFFIVGEKVERKTQQVFFLLSHLYKKKFGCILIGQQKKNKTNFLETI